MAFTYYLLEFLTLCRLDGIPRVLEGGCPGGDLAHRVTGVHPQYLTTLLHLM